MLLLFNVAVVCLLFGFFRELLLPKVDELLLLSFYVVNYELESFYLSRIKDDNNACVPCSSVF